MLLAGEGVALVFEHVAVDGLKVQFDVGGAHHGLALRQRHEGQQVVVFTGRFELRHQLFGQGPAVGELFYSRVRGVENHAIVIGRRGQQKTAGQRHGFQSRDFQQDFLRQHGRRLLIAQCLGSQFDMAEPFEVPSCQPVGLAKFSPETARHQRLGEKQRSY
ncbi:hypothetical protein D3C78_1389000 [compost metagenome]